MLLSNLNFAAVILDINQNDIVQTSLGIISHQFFSSTKLKNASSSSKVTVWAEYGEKYVCRSTMLKVGEIFKLGGKSIR